MGEFTNKVISSWAFLCWEFLIIDSIFSFVIVLFRFSVSLLFSFDNLYVFRNLSEISSRSPISCSFVPVSVSLKKQLPVVGLYGLVSTGKNSHKLPWLEILRVSQTASHPPPSLVLSCLHQPMPVPSPRDEGPVRRNKTQSPEQDFGVRYDFSLLLCLFLILQIMLGCSKLTVPFPCL